jgi:hypothetical protein
VVLTIIASGGEGGGSSEPVHRTAKKPGFLYVLRISNFELHKQLIILCGEILSSVHLGAGNCDEVPGAEPLRGRAQRDDHGGQLQEKMSSD